MMIVDAKTSQGDFLGEAARIITGIYTIARQ